MTIKRTINGTEVEIELTGEEVEQAHRLAELEYHANDVKARWQELYGDDDTPFPYEDKTANAIAERAESIMNKMDNYWDCYWACFEVAIKEFEDNK